MGQTTNPRDSQDTIPNAELHEGGEGNVEADRRYRAGVTATVKSGKVEELAEEAREAIDGDEGKALREAEKKGKEGGSGAPRPS
jgi:hypothetical protein